MAASSSPARPAGSGAPSPTTGDRPAHTPLHDRHRQLGAKMVDFSGWDMPLFYQGILPEHQAVRRAAGMFDVSHMGRFRVRGAASESFLDRMLSNRVQGLADGQAAYSAMCYPDGGTVDDLIVYRVGAGDYWLVVNAGNRPADFAWLERHRPPEVTLDDLSNQTALLAVQGPKAVELLRRLGAEVGDLAYYHFRRAQCAGVDALVARLGYTGEDGFELMVPADSAPGLWDTLLQQGTELGLVPAGLGARDTLRFEAGFCLYGHELSTEIGPLEAGIGFAVKLDKDFIGAETLRQQKAAGVPRRLAGVKMDGARIPRQGSTVRLGSEVIGQVTSGMFAPTLGCAYALALVGSGKVTPGTAVEVEIRTDSFPARIVER
ncbi:MAG TPA: glycine cleavage system aminomethyltransferase GcvT, partial [Candidatus Udaeobacter sp.]|nr:glycine cleavage system aminomethyltransferase GcvT [Candidatus Udaeobacter sp.]